MNEKRMRISFDASVDEHVDVQILLLRRSKTGRSLRRRSAILSGAPVGIVLFVGTLFSRSRPSSVFVVGSALFATAVALFWGLAYLLIYDLFLRRRLRRFVTEHVGNSEVVRCDMELRPEGVWTRQNGVELLLPWDDAIGVTDTSAGVQVDFRSGIALARNRGFTTEDERRRFSETARTSMALASGEGTAQKRASDEA
jgi:hypothetical protein